MKNKTEDEDMSKTKNYLQELTEAMSAIKEHVGIAQFNLMYHFMKATVEESQQRYFLSEVVLLRQALRAMVEIMEDVE